jgi:hypothetical protein
VPSVSTADQTVVTPEVKKIRGMKREREGEGQCVVVYYYLEAIKNWLESKNEIAFYTGIRSFHPSLSISSHLYLALPPQLYVMF